MKQIVNISIGPESEDYALETEYNGKKFSIQRFGTDGDLTRAENLLLKWNKKAEVLCISGMKYPATFGKNIFIDPKTRELLDLCKRIQTLVLTGETIYRVSQEWSIRNIHFTQGNNYFTNARVLFFSGLENAVLARVMSEYTDNLMFADAMLLDNIPRIMTSLKELELYSGRVKGILKNLPFKNMVMNRKSMGRLKEYQLVDAVKNANILVIPHEGFYEILEHFSGDDLKGKTVITSTVYEERIDLLTQMGVDVIIDTTPKVIEPVVEGVVVEALLMAAMDVKKGDNLKDDLLEIISEQRLDPRIIYPFEQGRRVNRFAHLIHPLSRDDFKRFKALEITTDIVPSCMTAVEKLAVHSPPMVYSKITGIKSPTGVEAEGWLIAIGETPEQMQAKSPEFTTKKIMQAAEKAKKLGAQVMGIGILPKGMLGIAMDLAKNAPLPITNGNSYIASTALWAAADAVRQMGLTKLKKGKILRAKAMVIGATGDVGAICSRLLATAFEEVFLVSRNTAKLLGLQESIQEDKPGLSPKISTRADRFLDEMDVVVLASSGAQRSIDIMQVKPGCVIVDITRPMIFTASETAKRQDVLVITGGEIELPGDQIEMKDIGLAPGLAYAGLAETIILALEGRFDDFIKDNSRDWEKVKEIYKLGLKHGMKLSSISGVDGVLTREDIARVKANALKARG